ncbi:NAD-dependent epimerase/dehydratase family protein ['Paenibacillus yunnanensis' Narsing Rao et al. 2020]|uniref:NAD-dependent epimerase/dehydratase family protein n=1 Tax=Paenibacillus tengchongensis TaxID=2608684 RepID=UPI00124D8DBF|nr:NAD-dependent epimerase/dehydratase family protein [Paenibacillus tengchongensis]
MNGRRILITGAGGFTGRHAVSHFHSAGAEVTAVVRRPPKEPNLFAQGVATYICDLGDRAAVHAMIEAVRPDEVLHLAGRNSVPESWRDPLLYMETNVMATLYLLESLRGRPAGRILVAGSRLKYRPGTVEGPPHPYSLSKTLEELVSLAWGTLFKQPVLLAEPCNLIGPGPSTGFCSLLARHIAMSEAAAGVGEELPPFRLSSRYAQRDFLDVRDAVSAYDVILRRGETGRVYRIDSGKPRRLGDIASELLSRASAPVPMDWGPEDSGPDRDSATAEASGREADAYPAEVGAGVLGWKAEIPPARSLADILDYYRGAGKEG